MEHIKLKTSQLYLISKKLLNTYAQRHIYRVAQVATARGPRPGGALIHCGKTSKARKKQ